MLKQKQSNKLNLQHALLHVVSYGFSLGNSIFIIFLYFHRTIIGFYFRKYKLWIEY